MVFKKTEGLSTRVRPNGMPNLSGYKAAAAQYDQISAQMYNLGADMRKNDLNAAILEAEAAGRTAGATYDKDKNLVPLTNLSLSDSIESQVFGSSEKESLRAAYKKAALSTYAASINLDARNVARAALAANPSDPDGVRGALDGYIENLGVEDEVMAYVMPNIVAQFTAVEGQANAAMIQDANETKERIMLEHIDDLTDRVSVITAKGSGVDEIAAQGHAAMISDLNGEIEQAFETLETIGYKPDQIDALREVIAGKVATRASVAHIERFYTSTGSLSASLKEIQKLENDFSDDPNIDGGAVAQEMRNHLTRLATITNALEKEKNDTERDVYDDARLAITLGEISSKTEILALPVNTAQKETLISHFNSYQSSVANSAASSRAAEKAANLEMFDTFMIPIKNPQNYSESELLGNRAGIISMWESGKLPAAKYTEFISAYQKVLDAELKEYNEDVTGSMKEKGDSSIAFIKSKIGPSGDFSVTEQWLDGQLKVLEEKGYIGTGDGAVMTRSAYQTMVNGYLNKRNSYIEKNKNLFLARAAVENGTASKTQISLLQSNVSARFIPDETGSIWTHSDPEIREQNFELATKFFLKYKILPAELQEGLADLNGAAHLSEEAFVTKLQIFNKIFESIKRGTASGGSTDLAMPEFIARHIMKEQGINVGNYEIAAIKGRIAYRDAMATAGDSTNSVKRVLNNLDNSYPDLRSAIKGEFKDSVSGQGYFDFFVNNFVPFVDTKDARELSIIDRLRSSGPSGMAGDIDEAYIGDDRLMRLIELDVQNQFATGQIVGYDRDSLQQAIKNAVVNLSADGKGNGLVGISIDSDNNPYWAVYPWYDAAKKSFGDVPVDDVGEAVFSDIRQRVLGPEFMIGKRQKDLLEGDGVIVLNANTAVGGDQRYTVSVVDTETNQAYNILNDYRFEFNSSMQNATYQLALSSVKNDKIRRFMASIPMMKSVVVSGAMQEIQENYEDLTDPSTFSRVLNFIVENNPFYEFEEGLQRSMSPSDRADMEILFRFMNGELRGDSDVFAAREAYE
nr:hypothetical protein [uncultured Mediterranean phage uvMED]BAR16941.1 hypothetical protein [uncultured Mediterranean phage uvMED]BAR17018.1 hypothetical protein [uncultured Mediterranean phage uvMED]BAR17063.1 hypothetical protein [uncultured Mediterranean phage uvMED]